MLRISYNLKHMKKLLLYMVFTHSALAVAVQTPKTELYDLIKKILSDSTVYEEIGDWAVGQPKKIPVKWNANKLEMSERHQY